MYIRQKFCMTTRSISCKTHDNNYYYYSNNVSTYILSVLPVWIISLTTTRGTIALWGNLLWPCSDDPCIHQHKWISRLCDFTCTTIRRLDSEGSKSQSPYPSIVRNKVSFSFVRYLAELTPDLIQALAILHSLSSDHSQLVQQIKAVDLRDFIAAKSLT